MRIPDNKIMKLFKTKKDAYQAGFNAGVENTIMNNILRPKEESPKWQDIGRRINLAGVQYSDYQLIAGGLEPGTVVDLVGEPGNPHDSKAIRVEYQKISLGYIPVKTDSNLQSVLWWEHNKGAKIIGVITAFEKSSPTWCMITIQCKLTYKDKGEQSTVQQPKDVRF